MKRYSIVVRETGSTHETVLCQCDSNPKAIAEALKQKMLRQRSGEYEFRIQRYDWIRIIDNQQPHRPYQEEAAS
jgi:hypothetical protein